LEKSDGFCHLECDIAGTGEFRFSSFPAPLMCIELMRRDNQFHPRFRGGAARKGLPVPVLEKAAELTNYIPGDD
jgi:hypothetical protein